MRMATESLSRSYTCADPAATESVAARLADACSGRRALITLSGPLGAGKTFFAAAFGRRWGSDTPLTSPTFTLLHEHRRARDGQRLYHLDGYRLNAPAEARDGTLQPQDARDGTLRRVLALRSACGHFAAVRSRKKPQDARALGIDELLEGADILLVEWPEHFGNALPEERIIINFSEREEGGRNLTLRAAGEDARALLRRMAANEAGG